MTSPDRLNRLWLTLLGALFGAAGIYGLVRGYGALGDARAQDPLLLENVRSYVSRNTDWFWPCAFSAAIVVAYLGYRLLRAQLASPHPAAPIRDVNGDDDMIVPSSVAAAAVADDLGHDPAIIHAHADLIGTSDEPAVNLALTVPDNVDLASLRSHIETYAMERARTAMDSGEIRPHVVLTLAETTTRHLQ